MEHFIREYGYYAIFFGCAVQGITVFFVGGLIAHHGELHFGTMFAVAMIGTMIWEFSFFFLGSVMGPRLVHHWPRLAPHVHKVDKKLGQHPFSFLLLYRYIPGGQSALASVIGVTGFKRLLFVLLDPLTAVLNGIVLASAGYFFGKLLDSISIF